MESKKVREVAEQLGITANAALTRISHTAKDPSRPENRK
jgi:hypothetical protein